MFDIWFCKYDEVVKDDYNLEYLKLIFKDVNEQELNNYIKFICDDLKYSNYKIIDKYYVKLDEKYMLFICESEEDDNV